MIRFIQLVKLVKRKVQVFRYKVLMIQNSADFEQHLNKSTERKKRV
jgi:hypothetical protein